MADQMFAAPDRRRADLRCHELAEFERLRWDTPSLSLAELEDPNRYWFRVESRLGSWVVLRRLQGEPVDEQAPF